MAKQSIQSILLPAVKSNLKVSLLNVGAPNEAIKAVDDITMASVQEATNIIHSYIMSVASVNSTEQFKKIVEEQNKKEKELGPLKNLLS